MYHLPPFASFSQATCYSYACNKNNACYSPFPIDPMHNRTMVESPAARIGVPQTCPWQTSLSSIQVGPPRPTNPTPLVPNPPRRAILGRRHPRRAILGRRHPLLKLDEDGKKTYFHVIRLSLFFPAFAHCIYIVLKLFFFSTYHACMNVCMYLLAHFLTLSIYRCLSLFFVRVSLFFSLSLSLSLSVFLSKLLHDFKNSSKK